MIETPDGRKLKYFVHKYSVGQVYGGPEEGGWWYEAGEPVEDWTSVGFEDEEEAFEFCRDCNAEEHERRKKENRYGYTSVLSYRDDFYAYDVDENPVPAPYPTHRPHYE